MGMEAQAAPAIARRNRARECLPEQVRRAGTVQVARARPGAGRRGKGCDGPGVLTMRYCQGTARVKAGRRTSGRWLMVRGQHWESRTREARVERGRWGMERETRSTGSGQVKRKGAAWQMDRGGSGGRQAVEGPTSNVQRPTGDSGKRARTGAGGRMAAVRSGTRTEARG